MPLAVSCAALTSLLDDDWEDMLDDVPDAMPAGPSGPAQPGVITAVVAAWVSRTGAGDCRGPRSACLASQRGVGASIVGHQHLVPALLALMEFAHGRQPLWRLARGRGASIGVMTTRLAALASNRIARPVCAA